VFLESSSNLLAIAVLEANSEDTDQESSSQQDLGAEPSTTQDLSRVGKALHVYFTEFFLFKFTNLHRLRSESPQNPLGEYFLNSKLLNDPQGIRSSPEYFFILWILHYSWEFGCP